MAVSNYIETNNYPQNGGRGFKVKDGFGNGSPVADPIFEDDIKYPVGSRYTDLDDGTIYTKTASGNSWVAA